MVRSIFGLPQAMSRVMPQQPAVRTMFERLTLLRMGARQRINSRGKERAVGGLWRWWAKCGLRSADCEVESRVPNRDADARLRSRAGGGRDRRLAAARGRSSILSRLVRSPARPVV